MELSSRIDFLIRKTKKEFIETSAKAYTREQKRIGFEKGDQFANKEVDLVKLKDMEMDDYVAQLKNF